MAWSDKPFAAKVILGQPVILVGFRPSKRLESHEGEITGVGREITFTHYETASYPSWITCRRYVEKIGQFNI